MNTAALALIASAAIATGPQDADTRAWWRLTSELSSDAMEGRDTGSPGYDRAAAVVARRLAAAGLKPIGDQGGWYQRMALEQVQITRATVGVGTTPMRFLHDLTAAPLSVPASLDLPIAYRGYCAAGALGDVRGKLVVCHGSRRPGMPTAQEQIDAIAAAGGRAAATIADPGFTIEPPRWPYAYARTVWIAGSPPTPPKIAIFTLNADALGKLTGGSGRNAPALIQAGSRGAPLPSFDVPGRFKASFTLQRRKLQSANVLGLLPGTDPALASQPMVLTAHLDGYGYGEPVRGDSLYNGTLDDAAYVALLVRLVERRGGQGFRRPVVIAAVTGEEKGLHGSRWLAQHWPSEIAKPVGNINLDQLRPIFPLKLLTVHGLNDSSLGDDARKVAEGLGIAVQTDPEPQRNLLQRTDHWNFMQAGVPAVNFVFGYKPGSESERIYRRWYQQGYHRPQDDLAQAIDWQAARDFNRFFYGLVSRVADQERAPAWNASSPLAPRPR
ncbi:M28 family peptidase [Sphingomonas humi]|uniref:M20/M25/M40 family metallo-hydrolase n=1 Tax=Sphingomonas humi TaxID=335630 RepID=A0ABP7SEM5_9SPHN